MLSFLVTGGLGFIGSHVCVELIKTGYRVIIIDNLENSKISVLDSIKYFDHKDNVIFYQKNILDNIDYLFENHDIYGVIHLAGLKAVNESVQNPLLYYDKNLNMLINLLKTMNKYNCKKLIFSSSCTVYGSLKAPFTEDMQNIGCNISSSYGKTKYFQEQILQDLYNSDKLWSIIILRYFNPVAAHESGLIGEDPNGVPNNLMPIIYKVINGEYKELTIYGKDYDTYDGTCVRDFIHVVDLAKGHIKSIIKLLENNIFIYNLGTGNGISVLTLVNNFIKINKITDFNYKFVDRRRGDVDILYALTTKAENELGWKAEKTLDDMCIDGYNYVKKINTKI